jgi:hypothetical protein
MEKGYEWRNGNYWEKSYMRVSEIPKEKEGSCIKIDLQD